MKASREFRRYLSASPLSLVKDKDLVKRACEVASFSDVASIPALFNLLESTLDDVNAQNLTLGDVYSALVQGLDGLLMANEEPELAAKFERLEGELATSAERMGLPPADPATLRMLSLRVVARYYLTNFLDAGILEPR